MNPIYRHSFVSALLANGAFASTTGMIDGNNDNYFYTRNFIPISNVYPRKIYQSFSSYSGGIL